jgi:opacity protein-like surface antigen
MRIVSIAIVTIFLCAASAAAQGLTTGVKGGVNVSTVDFDSPVGDTTLDWRLSAIVGGFVRFPLLSWVELQPEVLYSVKGGKREDFGVSSSVLLDYLDVPVLARMPLGGRKYFAVAGPYVGFRLRARTRTEFSGSTEEVDISDVIERMDFGLAVGGGVEFGAIVLDGRYSFSLTDIDKDTSEEASAKNRVVSVTVGFRF